MDRSMDLFGKSYARSSVNKKFKKFGDFKIVKGVICTADSVDEDDVDGEEDEEE